LSSQLWVATHSTTGPRWTSPFSEWKRGSWLTWRSVQWEISWQLEVGTIWKWIQSALRGYFSTCQKGVASMSVYIASPLTKILTNYKAWALTTSCHSVLNTVDSEICIPQWSVFGTNFLKHLNTQRHVSFQINSPVCCHTSNVTNPITVIHPLLSDQTASVWCDSENPTWSQHQ
jgi:hypothetical protein